MNRSLSILLLCGLCAAAVYSQTAQKPPAPVEFELQVGKMVYHVAADQPFTLTTPKGERVEVVLRRKEILRFEQHSIAFNYPRTMEVSVEKEVGATTVTVECAESPMVIIQTFSLPTTPAEVRKEIVEGFREEFKSQGAKFIEGSGKTVRRKIGGVEREGQVLEFLLVGQQMKTEVYAFTKDKTVMAVVLQSASEDEELAKKYFPIVIDSLK